MSCQLIPIAWFDVNSVRKRLFHDYDAPEILLGRPDKPEHGLSSSESNPAWLQDCLSYLSPSREILIFAKKCNVVILTSKWESQKKGNASCKYVVFWSGTLDIEKTDSITSVLCLPLASVGKSSHHGADWTCIVVGYSSGFVGFYTENGSLIISEQFHEEPVVKLKCHSHIAPSYPGEIEYQEELIIVYQSAVVSLNGFALFQTLRGCRSHLAKVKANYRESVNPPPLAFKKWGFTDQRVAGVHGSGIMEEFGVHDCEVIGPSTPHSFDHLHHHHLLSSQLSSLSSFRPRPPATSMVVATGLQPFVGFHYYVEGAGRQTIYRDVARAVTDRLVGTLSNTVSSWIFGGQNTQEKAVETRPSSEAADPMECRFGLCDPLRAGGNIVMSQNRRLSAVTDNLGRIILVDNFKGIAVRLWKGYRDAHCGWMEVMEESLHLEQQKQRSKMGDYEGSPSPHSSPISPDGFRKAHFLIVHCPRSSILQVLSVQKGSKIATIPVAKGTRFLYMNHGLVGTNNVAHKKRRGHNESSCVIIEPSGFIKEVLVPFHFALSEQSSEKVKDLHLIRRIKKALRCSAPPCTSEVSLATQSEICSLLGDLHCSQSLALALQTISTHRYTTVDLSLAAVNAVLQRLQLDSAESESTSPATLWSMCQQLQQLISLYAKAKNAFQDEEIEGEDMMRKNSVPSSQLSEKEKEEVMMKKFKLSEFELKELLALLKLLKSAKDNAKTKAVCRVSFADEHALSLPEYLSYFKLRIPDDSTSEADEKGMEKWRNGDDPPTLSVSLKPSAHEQNMENICHFLFNECLASWRPHDSWKSAIAESGIKSKDLLLMVMNTWLWSGWHLLCLSFIDSLQRLTSIIQAVCSMPENNSCIHSLSWWEEVRTLLSKCESPFVALVGAVAARVVATSRETCGQKCTHIKGKGASMVKENAGGDCAHVGKEDGEVVPASKEEDWEQVTLEDMAWDKLIHSLEDVAYLEAAITCGPASIKSQMVTSLEHVSSRGRGYISEMVAQWVLSCSREFGEQRWSPEALIEILQKSSSGNEDSQAVEPGSPGSLAFDLLVTLRNRFPQSLSISALTANITWECARLFASLKCNTPILSRTLDWLQAIPSFQIRRGVCGLMWAVHLEHRLRAAVQLLECYPHVDAIPEKVILDEVGLPSLLMLQDLFVNIHKFLELIREWVDIDVEDEEIEGGEELEETGANNWCQDPWGPTTEKTEEEQTTQQLSNGPPLVELALVQPPLPPSLSSHPLSLDLFYQLSLAVCLLARVHPKGPTSLTQPISQLFNDKERALLLSLPNGERHRGRMDSMSSTLVRPRLLFVTRSISAICRSVDFSATLFKELISLALATAKSFGLPKDDIYRHLVCELYSCGRDQEAEELISVVGDKESLASQLLVIVLQRLKHYLDHCGNADQRSQVMATFSPASLAKLNDQHSNHLVCKDSPMRATEQLLSILVAYLDEESNLYSEAINILDAVSTLVNQ